jgi:hypothetical protein
MATAEDVVEKAKKVNPDMEMTLEAAEMMKGIPGPFLKMAIKKTFRLAREAGISVVDADFAAKIQDDEGR